MNAKLVGRLEGNYHEAIVFDRGQIRGILVTGDKYSFPYLSGEERYQVEFRIPSIPPSELIPFGSIKVSGRNKKELSDLALKKAEKIGAKFVLWDEDLIESERRVYDFFRKRLLLRTDIYVRRENSQNHEDTPFREKQYTK